MKTGLIVYVTGENCQDRLPEIKRLGRQQITADRVEIVAPNDGQADISYAWWSLVARGMHRVICNVAHVEPGGRIRPGDNEMRLSG